LVVALTVVISLPVLVIGASSVVDTLLLDLPDPDEARTRGRADGDGELVGFVDGTTTAGASAPRLRSRAPRPGEAVPSADPYGWIRN
jgi:hypothetical protein